MARMQAYRLTAMIPWLAGWLALGAGCAPGASKLGHQPSWRQSSEVNSSIDLTSGAGGQRSQIYAPPGPAADFYNDPAVVPVPPSPLGDAVVAAMNQHMASIGKAPPTPDGRLFLAATELAAVVSNDAPLAYPLIEFSLQRHGIIEPSPHILIIWGPLDDPQPVLEQLAPRLPELMGSGTFARVGVGTGQRSEDGHGVIILALQSSNVSTKPIPRALPAGGSITVEGAIAARFRKPELFVTNEAGVVAQPALQTTRSGFRAEVSCTGRRGRQQIEITAVDESGSTVLANFPVWCNELAPTSISMPLVDEDDQPDITQAEAQARMLELVNRDRKQHGLGPLVLSQDVVRVAQAHSQDMHDTGIVAHVSPTTGSAADRVKQAGIRTSLVLENVARAYGVNEAEAGLMNSPGHRANILSDLATHIGIGIVLGNEVSGRREMFVTQVFTRVPPPIKLSEARRRVEEMVAPRSKEALLRSDESLRVIAQEYAAALAGGHPGDQPWPPMRPKLSSVASRFHRVTLSVTKVTDIETFDVDAVFADKQLNRYGLGMSEGTDSEPGERAFFIVFFLAQQR